MGFPQAAQNAAVGSLAAPQRGQKTLLIARLLEITFENSDHRLERMRYNGTHWPRPKQRLHRF
jgi:hypothetical protein